MEKTEDYIKFMTGKVVDYIETPKEERRSNRQKAKATKEPWLTRWFGMGGFAVAQWLRSRNNQL
ncbi:YqzE family protein [Paenibacillus sp. R14(2021)]|uniref:YqzE family protein n=1 Tax=Paenibacillus sp. R14(2021) TaxID=2859228 RepID=UPI001C6131D2|nr:YqzE family protein [Paenibacillus sp. R14(2021)]